MVRPGAQVSKMFKRNGPPSPKDRLADRVRSLSDQSPTRLPVEKPPPPPQKSKSRAERQPLYRQAAIVFDDGQRMTVALKNLSTTGARIEFFNKVDLPQELVLVEPTMRLRRRAHVAWQDDGVAGLIFID